MPIPVCRGRKRHSRQNATLSISPPSISDAATLPLPRRSISTIPLWHYHQRLESWTPTTTPGTTPCCIYPVNVGEREPLFRVDHHHQQQIYRQPCPHRPLSNKELYNGSWQPCRTWMPSLRRPCTMLGPLASEETPYTQPLEEIDARRRLRPPTFA